MKKFIQNEISTLLFIKFINKSKPNNDFFKFKNDNLSFNQTWINHLIKVKATTSVAKNSPWIPVFDHLPINAHWTGCAAERSAKLLWLERREPSSISIDPSFACHNKSTVGNAPNTVHASKRGARNKEKINKQTKFQSPSKAFIRASRDWMKFVRITWSRTESHKNLRLPQFMPKGSTRVCIPFPFGNSFGTTRHVRVLWASTHRITFFIAILFPQNFILNIKWTPYIFKIYNKRVKLLLLWKEEICLKLSL